ncbi:MAG: hypothetical protein PVJ39_01630 [Gammaproteobacteria bacterium]
MSSDSFRLFKAKRRRPLCGIDCLIGIAFFITLAIASGLLFEVSTAAGRKIGNSGASTETSQNPALGSINAESSPSTQSARYYSGYSLSPMAVDDSCEL